MKLLILVIAGYCCGKIKPLKVSIPLAIICFIIIQYLFTLL